MTLLETDRFPWSILVPSNKYNLSFQFYAVFLIPASNIPTFETETNNTADSRQHLIIDSSLAKYGV